MIVRPKKPTKTERLRAEVKAHYARVDEFNAKNTNDIARLQFRVVSLETLIGTLIP